jgi:hypothetical protein
MFQDIVQGGLLASKGEGRAGDLVYVRETADSGEKAGGDIASDHRRPTVRTSPEM